MTISGINLRLRAAKEVLPGVALALLVTLAAYVGKYWWGGPVMLLALLFGMPLHRLANKPSIASGINFSAKRVLRFGVALLGLRITLADVTTLGLPTAGLVVSGVVFTLAFGFLAGRLCGLRKDFAMLSAGAVAICGASAALAVSAVLPQHESSERQTILTVVGVTALSTVAMVLYPLLTRWIGFGDLTAGVFIGASIHDVAQVVGAGYMISPEAGETATLVKLMRVACLVPAVAVIAYLFRRSTAQSGAARAPALPLFLIAFVVLMLINSAGVLPAEFVSVLTQLSGFCLVLAVAALGVKTSLAGLVSVGVGPILAILLQTLLLGVFVLLILMI